MKKIIIALVSAFILYVSNSYAFQMPPRPMEACKEFLPNGFPISSRLSVANICRTAYAVSYDFNVKTPVWVAYRLLPTQTTGCAVRTNSFAPDQSLPQGRRAELSDFANSGFDMGHLANNADMSWNKDVARESFILTNIVPQTPNLNRGLWKTLETIIRSWAFNSQQGLTVYTGSIFDAVEDYRIGNNAVIVPNAFYKIVVNNDTKKSLAFIFPHKENIGTNILSVQTTVSAVEKAVKITFPTPDNKNIKNPLWSYNLKTLAEAKKTTCSN